MKMKKFASFDDYLDDQPAKNRTIIRALRRFVKRVEPGLEELVKWGNGCWVKEKTPKAKTPTGKNQSLIAKAKAPNEKVPVSYVYSAPDFVQFGFIRGSSLKDPRGLLEGNGQYVGHIKVRKISDIDEDATSLLRQAAR